MNEVILLGRLVREVEIIDIRDDLKIAKFSMAVKARKAGEDDSFFDIVAFGKQAEVLATSVKKGHRLLVEGALRQERFTDKEGRNRSKVSITLRNFSFIEKKDAAGEEEDDVRFDF